MLHTGGHILKNLRVSIFNSTRFFVAVVHHQYSHRRKNDGSTEKIKKTAGISKDDICQNQFTAYVVLAVKRKRQSYIKKKQREHEKETRTKKEAEQSEFRTAGYDMWSRMEPQNEKLMAAMQQLSFNEMCVVTEYVLK